MNPNLVDEIVNKINKEIGNEIGKEIGNEIGKEIGNEFSKKAQLKNISCKCSNPNCISNEFENSYFLNPKFYKEGDYYIHEHQDYLASIINKYKTQLKYDIEEIELEKKKGKNVNIKALDAEIKIIKDNYMRLINAICSGFFVFGSDK